MKVSIVIGPWQFHAEGEHAEVMVQSVAFYQVCQKLVLAPDVERIAAAIMRDQDSRAVH